MNEQPILYAERGSAAWITLNRPEALNAINPDLVSELDAALTRADANEALRCVVITGAGRAFCAGADLKAINGQLAGDAGDFTKGFVTELLAVLNRIERFRLPVIAALNGMALAGGLELVLVCDLVIAAESARIGDAHANYGLIPGGGGSVRLPRKIGPMRAKELMFTGAFVPAAALVDAGLVTRVVADDALNDAVAALVAELATKSPLGLARMKQLVNDGMEQPLATALRLEFTLIEAHAGSADMAEGLAAFEVKRKPKFIGR